MGLLSSTGRDKGAACPTAARRRPFCCGRAIAGTEKTGTLKNLSDQPAERLAVLRGDLLAAAVEGVAIEQALPHGHVVAAWETTCRIGLDRVLPRQAPPRY